MSNLFTSNVSNRAVEHLRADGWLVVDIDHDEADPDWWPLSPSPQTIVRVREARRGKDYQTVKKTMRESYTADLCTSYKEHRSTFDAIGKNPNVVIVDGDDGTYRDALVDVLGRLGHRSLSPLLHGSNYEGSPVVWVDTETGGTSQKHALLEIGAMVTEGLEGRVLSRYHALVLPTPGLLIEDAASAINGYSKQDWVHAESEHAAVRGFGNWLRRYAASGSIHAAGYNPSFDLRMLGYAAARIEDGWLHELLRTAQATDVHQAWKGKLGTPNNKLGTVCDAAGVDHWGPPHSAEADICRTRRFHLKMAGVRA